jgi:hypothetical protein
MGVFSTPSAYEIEDDVALVLDGVLLEVRNEILRAHAKHGQESMLSPMHSNGKRLAILGEEFGEICRALTYDNGSEANKREELIQTAAMAAAWVVADGLAERSKH